MKKPAKSQSGAIYYHDIGDYLAREEKLAIVRNFASIEGVAARGKWTLLTPNQHNDWINQRDPAFEKFLLLGDKADESSEPIFENYSLGVVTNRDAWAYNASRESLLANIQAMINVFNVEAGKFKKACKELAKDQWPAVEEIIDSDPKKISWTRSLKNDVRRGKSLNISDGQVREALYRPFTKQNIFFSRRLNEMVYQQPRLFPRASLRNIAICVSSNGTRAEFSVIIADCIPDLSFADKSSGSQCFPLYLYEKDDDGDQLQFDKAETVDGYHRRDAITDATLKKFREVYGDEVSKEDIFFYIYGVFHSPEYRTRFAADLKKMLPRIPLTKEAKDFKGFSDTGRKLAEWHLNYETVEPWRVKEHSGTLDFDPAEKYKVQKMVFARPTADQKASGAKFDKTRIVYNSHVTLADIPLEAYEYVVNGKPAIEWIMERYQYTRDKDSGIVNDPNDWSREHSQPRYIIDLLKRVVRVSMETMKVVRNLPALNERPN